jgi:uncharacterized membrane protein YdjX (TVP38/TMEM64 family)
LTAARKDLLPSHSRRAIGLLIVVAFLAVAAASGPIHKVVADLTDRTALIITAHDTAGVLVFVAAAIVSATFAFFSSAMLIPVAIAAWGKGVTFALLWFGWLLGGLLAWVAGRYLGHPVARRLIGSRRLARYEHYVRDLGGFGPVLLFQLALPSEIPAYLLGTVRFPVGTYALVLMIAEVPFAVGAVYLADTFVQGNALALILLGCAGVAASWTAAHALHLRLWHHNQK